VIVSLPKTIIPSINKDRPYKEIQDMDKAKMNFNTSNSLKDAFLDLCKEQHVTATSRFNDFMRSMLDENGKTTKQIAPTKDSRSLDGWRDDLVRG
jgi:hypothetical protein